jgi:5-methylthioadenosine/S-adenosylhomocysteine deaminase
MLLKNCRFLVTQNAKREILERMDVRIHESVIAEIGTGLATAGAHVFDCSERIVMPGLINAHTHLGMTGLRGVCDDEELHPWLAKIIAHEDGMRDEDFSLGARIGICEALRTGTTTVVDHYAPIGPAAHAAHELGIRFVGIVGVSDIHAHAKERLSIPDAPSDRVTFGLGPHAIASVSEERLLELKKISDERGVLLHMHLSETRKERAEFKARTGMLPVEYLERIGFLGPRTMLVHCIWLTKGELDILARREVKVVHCPQSNMKLAGGGVMPVREMRERGIAVALGTDSAASNNALDMFREMHTAALLHKHHYWDPYAGVAQDILDMATIDGARAIGRENLGAIAHGMRADIIALDLRDPSLQPCTRDRVISHLVHAACGMNVSETIVDGEMLLQNKGPTE